MPGLQRVPEQVGIAVSNIDRSIHWYHDVLGLERAFEEAWGSYPAVLLAGETGVALFPTDDDLSATGTFEQLPHIGFRATGEGYESAKEELRERRIEFTESDHTIAGSFYVLDPDGYLVEITTYD